MPCCTTYTTCTCNLLNPDTWSGSFSGTPKFDRGFTGHEHLYGFGLINMKSPSSESRAKWLTSAMPSAGGLGEANGRMYDPVMSGFLSPDNYIQSPGFSQSFNRYAYCFNNPLKYTDPSGEIAVIDDIIIAAAIGAIINVSIQGFSGNINNGGDFFLAAGIGALSGAIGGIAGGAVSGALGTATTLGGSIINGTITGAAGGFAGGFVGGAGNAWMGGASFGQGLRSGLIGGGYGALGGALIGGVTGGIQYNKTIRLINKGCKNVGIREMSQVNDGNLHSLQQEWFPDVPMDDYVVNFSIDNVPTEELEKMIANNAAGKTIQEAIDGIMTGKSSVYFNRDMIPTLKDMFFTMGHEFVHVGQISTLAGLPTTVLTPEFILKMEVGAYSYSAHLGQSFAANPISLNEMAYLSTLPPSEINELSWLNFRWLWNFNAP